ncbi:hypothetical protein GYMLUDRAFT_48552 [Collybiopsis luxurians FD-317 M1]|uniref:Unplaced genomic scaffold GYMLUscaffold_66, whole genome shotgun sequence n=1 Tax=Collybiopsis luxurians FD-317 M1 TaxID=944289 RepID=A0A0D0CI58_9AGAR|nr:hypothetical protein GYMLUDRAFT_48552 [Collybiopsis luxurians FD-317 M1]
MILYRAYKTRHELRILRKFEISLLVIVLRDGTFYFGIMTFANAINISTFYYPLPYVRGSLSIFASSISVTMMSRLVFNLHEIADSGLYTSHISTIQFTATPSDSS